MPRACTVCNHAQRSEIDTAIANQTASIRGVARQFGVGSDALERHRRNHLTQRLATARQRRDSQDDDLLAKIENSHARAENLYAIAESVLVKCQQDPHTTLRAISTCCSVLEQSRKWTELLAELVGALKRQTASVERIEVVYVTQPLPQPPQPTSLPALPAPETLQSQP